MAPAELFFLRRQRSKGTIITSPLTETENSKSGRRKTANNDDDDDDDDERNAERRKEERKRGKIRGFWFG